MLALSTGEITAYLTALAGVIAAAATFLKTRGDNDKKKVESVSIGESALANAVGIVEQVHERIRTTLNAQIDELLEDNKKLKEGNDQLRKEVGLLRDEVGVLTASEVACRQEVKALREEVSELRTNS